MSKRRVFSREFKIEAVKLVTQQGYSVSQAAGGCNSCTRQCIM